MFYRCYFPLTRTNGFPFMYIVIFKCVRCLNLFLFLSCKVQWKLHIFFPIPCSKIYFHCSSMSVYHFSLCRRNNSYKTYNFIIKSEKSVLEVIIQLPCSQGHNGPHTKWRCHFIVMIYSGTCAIWHLSIPTHFLVGLDRFHCTSKILELILYQHRLVPISSI
jgi:hypothetical protein